MNSAKTWMRLMTTKKRPLFYPIHCGMKIEAMRKIIEDLCRQCKKEKLRIVFVDLAPTLRMVEIARFLADEKRHTLVAYFDHHATNQNVPYVEEIYSYLQDWPFNVVSRNLAFSTASMVPFNYFLDQGVDVVFLDSDFDGVVSALFGSGATYPGMISDVNIIDSAGKYPGQVSFMGKTLMASLYRYNRFLYEDRWRNHFIQTVNVWFYKLTKSKDSKILQYEHAWKQLEADVIRAEDNAEDLVKIHKQEYLSRRIIFFDLRFYSKIGEPIDESYLKRLTRQKYGQYFFCTLDHGPHKQEMVKIQRPEALKHINLWPLATSNSRSKASFRMYVPFDEWDIFVENLNCFYSFTNFH